MRKLIRKIIEWAMVESEITRDLRMSTLEANVIGEIEEIKNDMKSFMNGDEQTMANRYIHTHLLAIEDYLDIDVDTRFVQDPAFDMFKPVPRSIPVGIARPRTKAKTK